MGLLNFITAPRKMEDIKMALIAKHIFNTMDSPTQKAILFRANNILHDCHIFHYDNSLETYEEKLQFVFISLAMAELGIEHGFRGFQWTCIKRPFMVQHYDDMLWQCTMELVKRKFGIEVAM